MSASEALEAHSREVFKEFVLNRLKQINKTRSDLAAAVYGRNEKGKPKGSGHVSQIIGGTQRATQKTLERWAPVLDVPIEELVAVLGGAKPTAALPAQRQAIRPTGEQFSMSIGSDGFATIKLNVSAIPMGQAMKVISALQAVGLFDAV